MKSNEVRKTPCCSRDILVRRQENRFMPGRNEFSDKTFNSNFRHVPYYRNGGGKHIYKFLLNLSNALGLTFQRFL